MVHTFYREPGGEDRSFRAEVDLLRRHGHHVVEFTSTNDEFARRSPIAQATGAVWNRDALRELERVIAAQSPEVVHVQNTFPAMSPAVIRGAKAAGLPVVMSLRNYRLTCVNSYLFRDGGPCESCVGSRFPWRGVVHRCYRTRAASAVVATMNAVHHFSGTWRDSVDRFILMSEFQRSELASLVPAEKTVVKPNFLDPDPGRGAGGGGFVLYVGRLSPEKGILQLVRAWPGNGRGTPLVVVGDGPDRAEIDRLARDRGIHVLGRRGEEDVLDLVGTAEALVLPSLWFEGFPRVIVEAFARGTPVIGYDIGTQGAVLATGGGMTVPVGRPGDLVDAAISVAHDSSRRAVLSESARARFLRDHTAERNYEILIDTYSSIVRG